MTQMLLFDTPRHESSASPVVALPSQATQAATVQEIPSNAVIPGVKSQEKPSSNEYERGVNSMGDLARLVLLRYDLVAARRARRNAGAVSRRAK